MFVKVEPIRVSQVDIQKRSNFTRSFFRRVRILLLFGGINPGKYVFSREKILYSNLKKTYIVAAVILNLTTISLFCFDIYKKTSETRDIARTVSYFLMFVTTLELIINISYRLPKLLPAVEESFDRHENQYKFNKDVLKLPRNLKIATYFVVLFAYVMYPLSVVFTKRYPEILCETFPVCYIEYPWQDIVLSISVTAYGILFAIWAGLFIVSVFFSLLFVREFTVISNKFKELSTVTYTSDHFEKRFEELTKNFESLVDILNGTNCCVEHYSFIALFSAVPIHCSLVYAALDKNLTSVERAYVCFGMSFSLILTGVRIFMEALVSSKAHEPLQSLWKMRKDNLSEKALQKLNFFVSRLTGDSIGFSIYGLLTMNMPTLLAIFGTLATYFIIAIQFRPQDNPSQCDLPMKNNTHYLAPLRSGS